MHKSITKCEGVIMTLPNGPGLTTPTRPSFASTNPRDSTPARDSSFSFRPSIGSAIRLSEAKTRSPCVLNTGKITKEQTVFDDFDILKDDSVSKQEKAEARERLTHVFSTTTGQPYIEDSVKKLEDQYHRLTFELNLAAITRGIIANIISDKILSLEFSWQQFVVEVIEKTIEAMGGTYQNSGEAIVFDAIKAALKGKADPVLKDFLTDKYTLLNLRTKLSAKTIAELQKIIARIKALYLIPERLFLESANTIISEVFSFKDFDEAKKLNKIYSTINSTIPETASGYIRSLQDFAVPLLPSDNGPNEENLQLQDALSQAFEYRINTELLPKIIVDQVVIEEEALSALQERYRQRAVDLKDSTISVIDYADARIHFACNEHYESKINTLASHDVGDNFNENLAALEKSKKNPRVMEKAQEARDILYCQLKEHPQLRQNTLDQYPQKTIDELKEHDGLHKEIEESLHRDIDAVGRQLEECLDYQEKLKDKLSKHARQGVPAILAERVCVLGVDIHKKNALDHAIDCHDPELIAMILANAHASNVLEKLLDHSLSKLSKDNFKYLIAGAYLFDPENGGLYNQQLVKSICERPRGLTTLFNQAQDPSMLSDDDSDESDSKQSFSVFFNQDYQPNLTDEEKSEINQLILTSADDENFARFIKQVDSGKWAHPVKFEASEIRAELKRRYVGAEAQPIPHSVQMVLNKNLAIAERADRLATFYDTATHHICTSYSKDQELYKDKTGIILKRLQNSSNDTLSRLENEAENIANAFVDANSDLNDRRPVCVADPHVLSATQRHFANAKIMLSGEGFFASARRGIFRFINKLTGSEYQHPKDVLERPIATVGTGKTDVPLTENLIRRIPLTADEKAACVTRATLARGAFKHTLEYLEARRPSENVNNDKKTIMENYLQQYIHGRTNTGTEYSAANLINDLETANEKTGMLGKRLGLFSSKTARILEADLRRSKEILSAFSESPKASDYSG